MKTTVIGAGAWGTALARLVHVADGEVCLWGRDAYALTKLASLDIIKYVVTQNVDGLHRRSGLPRSKHAVLHGCVFTEKCERCGEEYFRDYDLGGVSFQKTGRQCTKAGCSGDLRDTILDWDDALPEEDWDRSQDECEAADLVLTLGTSLRIEPAGSLPLRAKKFVIVNWTIESCLLSAI